MTGEALEDVMISCSFPVAAVEGLPFDQQVQFVAP
jgi:hypothetical protein